MNEPSLFSRFLLYVGFDSKERLNKPIHTASRNGDLEEVKRIIAEGDSNFFGLFNKAVDLDALDMTGFNALHYAVKEGFVDVVKFLIDAGANVHCPEAQGLSPFHLAVYSGQEEIAKYLLLKGATKSEGTDLDLNRLLVLSARFGNDEKVRLALNCGADVNFSDSTKNTALTYALTRKGQTRLLRTLLLYGASVTFRDEKNRTPLHIAIERGDTAAARILFQATPMRPTDFKIMERNDELDELIRSPPPFKVKSLKQFCWIVIYKNHLDEEAKHIPDLT